MKNIITRKLKTLTKNEDSFEVLIGSLVAFIVKIFSAIGAFLLNLVVARQLGAEESGYFFLSLTIVLLFSVVGRLGADNAIIRFTAGFKSEGDDTSIAQLYWYLLIRVLPMLSVFSVLSYCLSDWASLVIFDKPLLSPVLSVMSLAIIPLSLGQLHGFFLQGIKRIVPAMLFNSGAMAILLLIITIIVTPESSLQQGVLYIISALIVFASSVFVWSWKRSPVIESKGFSLKYEVSNSLKPLFVIMLMAQITQWAGQLMLGIWGTSIDVALFATALRTAMLTSFILISVNAIAAPKFASAYKQDDLDSIKCTVKSSSRIMIILALPIVIFMLVYADWLMGLFGDEFKEGAIILRILAIGQFVNVMTGSVGYLLQMTGHERVLRNNVMIASLIMIIGGPILIPLFGITGAAIVTALSVSAQNILSYFQVKKLLGINTLNLA